MKYSKASTQCKCGQERRPGQRTCRACHAVEQRVYRATHVMVRRERGGSDKKEGR